jgi:type IV pilus assembly protein PilN
VRFGDAEVYDVILINLLPHREQKRQRRKTAFNIGLGVAAVVGALTVGAWYAVLDAMKSGQMERNALLEAETKKLEEQIKDIANLRAEIDALKSRQKAVEDLQGDRNTPVHLLNELVRQMPDGVYLTGIKQSGKNVTLSGVAQTNERVSELLRQTGNSSPWLGKPELIEIKSAAAQAGRGQLYDFSMRVSLVNPSSAAPANAASGVAAAASGVKSAPATKP